MKRLLRLRVARQSALLPLLLLLATTAFAQTRIASDFEIAQMEKQLARSRDFSAQLSGRLNLGDLRMARNEVSLARAEYTKALETAERQRLDARRDADMRRYAEATSYAALAQAKLGRDGEAFALLEESARYTADDAETWNLYASAMNVLRRQQKAASAARNAVKIASDAVAKLPTTRKRLDLAVYQYALASALTDSVEAERVLREVTGSLRSNAFDDLRRAVAREESFEIYSSARGDAAAYVALLNRAQLRLGMLLEQRGDAAGARVQFARVVESRSDDVIALAALARLATNDEERERRYAEAFEANPFAASLVRDYRRHLAQQPPREIDDSTIGGRMRLALAQLERGDKRNAQKTLDALIALHPANETLRALRRETAITATFAIPSATPTASELRNVIDTLESITDEQRAALDAMTFTSLVQFDATPFASGTIDGLPFRFSGPTQFAGTFDATRPLLLTYRILGVAAGDALLLEPLRLETPR
ncbi:MAG TPA: hypothetical protein VGF48_17070 [Thermoanaerobaculia bacterium]|jgi:tetratricopeptide (TPR) repeat protein